jgi:ADP-heptose:LPS heptosyltransferase
VPALHLVERAFPQARRLLLTNVPAHSKAPAAHAVLEGSGLVHGYMDYPWRTRSVGELARLWWKVVRFRPQVVVYLMGLRNTAKRDRWFFRLCGVRRIVGLQNGDQVQPLFDEKTGLWEREGARLLRSVRSLGELDIGDWANWDLRLSAAEERRAGEALAPANGRPLIACGPGTKMQAKDWGQENWRKLLAGLSAELPGHALVLVGAKEDAAVADYAAGEWRGPAINVCGILTPRETAAVLRRAELFLGPDSGPMHLAAAYGVPCAIPFAAIDRPGRWYPMGTRHRLIYHHVDCENCRLTVCIAQQKKCLTSISVDAMMTAAREAWQKGQRSIACER